jgi:subtilase family serine protease
MRISRPAAAGACGAVLALAMAAGCSAAPGSTAPGAAAPGAQQTRRTPGPVAATPRPPGGGLTPAQLRAAYDLGPLLRHGIDGKGQTIVIVDSFGSPTITRDLAVFDKQSGLPAPPSLRVIQPAGPVPPFRPTSHRTGEAGETTLDVESAHVMAPDASILLVETPTLEEEGRSGFPQIVTAEDYVIRHHLGGVISQSFGATERTFRSKASLRQLRGPYLLAARPAYKVTVLAATGDTGAAGLTYSTHSSFPAPAVGWPASDPLVTAVGGTQLDLTPAGVRRRPDVAWNDSGGGRSAVFARPAYQDGVAGIVGRERGIPDISMDASCESGMETYSSFGGQPDWSMACGTSLATPLFAGIVALADQEAGHPLGAINPVLYRMAAAHDRGIVDILRGNNTSASVRGFPARRGYDLVSGLGTINAAYFVPELAKLAG